MSPKKLSSKEQRKVFARLSQKQKASSKFSSSTSVMRQFDDHPFYKNLLKYAIIPAWEESRKAKRENREIGELSEELLYHIRVFEYAGSLYEALKRLHDIPAFTLRGFSPRWMSDVKIMPQDWFVYNYANYRVIAYGIFDTAQLVVNDVLDLKEKPRNVKSNFINRPEIASNNLLPSLQKLQNILAKYRDERHKYVHRSTRPEIDLVDNLAAYQLMKEAKEKGFYKGDVPDRKTAQKYYEDERDKQVVKMQKETDEIFAAIIGFLDALHPVYEQKIEAFQSNQVGMAEMADG